MYLSWKSAAAVATLVAALTVGTDVSADSSPCKGLAEDACRSQDRCSWVKPYKTTKGRDVSAFCRKKPERNKSSSAPAAPKG